MAAYRNRDPPERSLDAEAARRAVDEAPPGTVLTEVDAPERA
jgi:hypothetical protein